MTAAREFLILLTLEKAIAPYHGRIISSICYWEGWLNMICWLLGSLRMRGVSMLLKKLLI